MKLHNKKSHNEYAAGISERFECKVSDKPMLMVHLADTLYSNKIRAIIRELSTNAADSHSRAKNKKPFDVYLPTKTNPEFRIRDYGTGMSEETIETLYRTYGESDKLETNEETGCFGIGSKSPFAYTDSFSVTSYLDGKKLCYNNIRTRNLKFAIDKLGVFNTEEPNGLEVSFPVQSQDINKFVSEAFIVFRPFGIKPNIASGHLGIREYVSEIKGDGWFISKVGQPLSLMNNVEYPIDSDIFEDDSIKNDPAQKFIQNSQNKYCLFLESIKHICILFNPGEVDIQLGRESLSYTARTIKTIKSRIDDVINEIKNDIEKQLKKKKDLWSARMLFHELLYNKYNDICYFILKNIPIKYKGCQVSLSEPTNGICLRQFFKEDGKVKRNKITTVNVDSKLKYGFYVKDINRAFCKRVEQHVLKNNINIAYLIEENEVDFFEQCGIKKSKLHWISKLKYKSDTKTSKTKLIPAYKFNTKHGYSYYNNYKYKWDDVQKIQNSGGYYVKLTGDFHVNVGNRSLEPSIASSTVKVLKSINDIEIKEWWGFKKLGMKVIKDDSSWINLIDFAKEKIGDFVKKSEDFKSYYIYHTFCNSNKYTGLTNTLNKFQIKDSESLFLKFLSSISDFHAIYENTKDKFKPLLHVVSDLRIDIETDDCYNIDTIHNRYPMIKNINWQWMNTSYDDISDYINLVDSQGVLV